MPHKNQPAENNHKLADGQERQCNETLANA